MSKRPKFKVSDENENSAADSVGGLATFNKYKKSSAATVPTVGETNGSKSNSSIMQINKEPMGSTSSSSNVNQIRNNQCNNQDGSWTVTEIPNDKVEFGPKNVGKSFAQTFAFLKNTDMYKLPPEPVKVEKPILKSNAIIVNPRQRGNPILKHVRNVPWEYGEIIPDYEVGKTHCVLFLSLRYHNLNPEYIHERLKALGNQYDLRVILAQVDIKNCQLSLKAIGKIAILAGCTLILAWSPEEAGRYLETYKQYEHKPPDVLLEKVDTDYLSKAQDILTTIKSINKTDVITLLSTFGSLKNIVNASQEEIELCPGFGTQKARRLHKVFHEPFKRSANSDVTIPGAATTGQSVPATCKLKRPSSPTISSESPTTKSKLKRSSSPIRTPKKSDVESLNSKEDSKLTNPSLPSSTSTSMRSTPRKGDPEDCKPESSISDVEVKTPSKFDMCVDEQIVDTADDDIFDKVLVSPSKEGKKMPSVESVPLSDSEPLADANAVRESIEKTQSTCKQSVGDVTIEQSRKKALLQPSFKMSKSEAINKCGLSRTRIETRDHSQVKASQKDNAFTKTIPKPKVVQNKKPSPKVITNVNVTPPRAAGQYKELLRSPPRIARRPIETMSSPPAQEAVKSPVRKAAKMSPVSFPLISPTKKTVIKNTDVLISPTDVTTSTQLTNEEYNELLASDDSDDEDDDYL